MAAPATIGLTASADDLVLIEGGQTTINTEVRNLAAAGNDDLQYSIQWAFPDLSTTTFFGQTRVADGGAGFNAHPQLLGTAGLPFGINTTTVTVTDPAATNSPQSQNVSVGVLSFSSPRFWWTDFLGGPAQEAVEPTIAPEQFAATGGGEDFAAAAGFIFNRENSPTAALDLDTVSEVGDPQITADFAAFANLVAGSDPTAGVPFTIFLDTTARGVYSKTFLFGFSDEELPGARAPGSVSRTMTVTLRVAPEPGTAMLLAVGLAALAARRRP